jgi:hypothetical protein
VPRRVNVPAADDLFRPTVVPKPVEPVDTDAGSPDDPSTAPSGGPAAVPRAAEKPAPRTASGRVKHDEKMTVYVTADELLEVEHARLELRRSHGLAVDRGRLVRAAVAMALADLDANGADSALVKRLNEA